MAILLLLGGVVGTGKSTIASLLTKHGFVHLDWDKITPAEKLIGMVKEHLSGGENIVVSEWFHPDYQNVEKLLKNIDTSRIVIKFVRLTASLETCLRRKPSIDDIIRQNFKREQTSQDEYPWIKIFNNEDDDQDKIAERILALCKG